MTSVSVITPAYQAEKFIARAVRSVLAQTHWDWEMIIVSDDEKDYAKVLKAEGISDPRLRFASTGRTAAGPGAARNVGLDAAKYDIIANLDADDAYDKNFLEHVLPTIDKHGICTTALRMINDRTGEEMPTGDLPPADASLVFPELMYFLLTYANIIYDRRRSRARWPQALTYGEDLLFWLLLLDDFPAIAYISSVNYHYYYREKSLSKLGEGDSTRRIYAHREHMIDWLKNNKSRIHNQENYDYLLRWLRMSNDIERKFNYTLVGKDVYQSELDKRRKEIFG